MICKKCGHFADDHSYEGAMESKYCLRPECVCNGWLRMDDEAEDFISNDSKLKKILNTLIDEEGSLFGDEGHWVIEWVDDVPYRVWRDN